MVDTAALLAAYDAQMRLPTGAAPSGMTYEHDGPVLRIIGGHVGRIRAPRDLAVPGADLDRLIARQRDYFGARGEGVEWKLCAHDRPADLPERLVAAGFAPVPEGPSAVLIGVAAEVAGAVAPTTAAEVTGTVAPTTAAEVARITADEPALPGGVALRQVSDAVDLRRFADLQSEATGSDCAWVAADLGARVAADPGGITILVAAAGDRFVCGALAIYDPGADFVALLGGATLPGWRGRGLYRALVAARAREAVARGYPLLHVDASPASAPILRRLGFHQITVSTHYQWTPPA